MTTTDRSAPQPGPAPRGPVVEAAGLDVIPEAERTGRASSLFWPWFAANVSVFGISYGSFVLGFGISAAQALVVGVVGTVASFVLCGLVAVAGKRGSAPTMTLSRAVFGVHGNRLPAAVSWVLTVGWETVTVSLAVLATATVLDRLGVGGGTGTKVAAFVVVALLVVAAGVLGWQTIARLQKVVTVVAGALTAVYVVLVAPQVDLATVAALPAGSTAAVLGAAVFMLTGFGLGWVNSAADYSRYLPRSTSSASVTAWTTVGGAVGPVVLVVFGVLLAGSSTRLSAAIGADPVGALATLLPTWFLVPFALVAVLGLVGGAVLDIYSSGLALLAVGLPAPRWAAALLDGVLMTLGVVYVVFFASSFIGPFQGFLITLGVPIAAWCGLMVADVALRRRDYDAGDLFRPRGRYGSVDAASVTTMVLVTAIGWGLVTSSTFAWQGYLLGPIGLGGTGGAWASANLGVLAALLLGFGVGLLRRGAVRRQEGLVPSGVPGPVTAGGHR